MVYFFIYEKKKQKIRLCYFRFGVQEIYNLAKYLYFLLYREIFENGLFFFFIVKLETQPSRNNRGRKARFLNFVSFVEQCEISKFAFIEAVNVTANTKSRIRLILL